MTREEAIKIIREIQFPVNGDNKEERDSALDMAIKALEQEPSGDLISKKSAKDAIYKVCLSEGNRDIFVKILDGINKLPSIEQEPSVEIVKTEETNDNGIKYLNINVSDGEVKRNPDVVRLCSDAGILEYVKSKTGHWIITYSHGKQNPIYECPRCYASNSSVFKNYCPNCGAKMVKPQESEDKG